MKLKYIILLCLLLVIGAGVALYFSGLLPIVKKEPSASALILVSGSENKGPEFVETQILLLRSTMVLSRAARQLENRVPASDREAWLQEHLDVGRDEPGSAAIKLRFHCADGELAKDVLNAVIRAYEQETDSIYQDAHRRKMTLLDTAISANHKKTESDRQAMIELTRRIRETFPEDSKAIEARIAKTNDTITALKTQRAIAETKDRVARIDSATSEAAESLEKDEATLAKLRPLMKQIATLESRIEAREKQIDAYENERMQTELTSALASVRVKVLHPPTFENNR